MAVGLAKAFKRNYLRSYLEKYGQKDYMFKKETYLKMIRHAWRGIQSSTVQHSFETILGPTSQSPRDPLKSSIPDSDKLHALKMVWPSTPDTVLQYYLTRDNDIGPSDFLRAKIHEMRHHEDFESCFESHTFTQLRDYDIVYSDLACSEMFRPRNQAYRNQLEMVDAILNNANCVKGS
ncbi:hypothetical protein BGZ65_012571, partial [Modicella reniformis]